MKLHFRQTKKKRTLPVLLLALSCALMPLQTEAASQTGQEELFQEKSGQETTDQTDILPAREEASEKNQEFPEFQGDFFAEPDSNPANEENISQQPPEGTVPSNGLVLQGNYYVLYIEGVPVTTAGWQELPIGKFLIESNGYVTARMEETEGIWKFYRYNSDTTAWDLQHSLWETVMEKDYYFDSSGICTQIYDTVSSQLMIPGNGQMVPANNYIYLLKDGRFYYFDSSGILNTASEWKKISSREWYYVNGEGYVASKLTNTQTIRRYYDYNYTLSKWEKQKNLWKTIEGKKYYFNSSGKCTKIYNPETEKCLKYKNGKMVTVKKETCLLQNGKLYYFNSKGVRVTKTGWQKPSQKQYIQIGKKGYVTYKMTQSNNIWKFYKYDYQTEKWQKQKKVWKTVDKKKYYFNASGKCTRIYNTKTRKCYDYQNGSMILIKNDVRNISGTRYYFDINGIRASSPGLYLTISGRIIYAESNGKVTKELSGEILEYTTADGKISSCRIRDSHFMRYYNSQGDITRQIDLNLPMVALTYDDGPSQFTSEILDILGQYGSTATFFVVGQRVPSYADTVKRAFDMKCEIGNHTYNHKILTKIDVSEIRYQIDSTNAVVQGITGVSPVVMRPPGGGYNGTVSSTVGMPMILWSIDTLDWKTRNALLTQSSVLDHITDGSIVLMHDLYSQTAAASRVIIPELVNRGYQLVTISELSDCRGDMANGGVYTAFP